MYDILIRGGRIVDGSGNPWFEADIGIKDERIAAIGRSLSGSERTLDASGLIVTPGFIDIHSHSDLCVVFDNKAESKIRQGVTTEVVGNCGISAAPLSKEQRNEVERGSTFLLPHGVTLPIKWTTVGEYYEVLERNGVSINVVLLVGHENLRIWAMGYEDGSPTGSQLDEMKVILEDSMKDGAFGFSTGLMYAPSGYASTEELAEIAKVAARYGGIHASHIRNEGSRVLEAVREIIQIAEASKVLSEISHIKSQPPEYWGNVPGILGLIEGARRRGLDVTCDVYPYTAGSTILAAVVAPLWAIEGGIGELVKRLQDGGLRERIKRESLDRHYYRREDCDRIFVAECPSNKQYEGQSIGKIACERSQDPVDLMLDLLVADAGATSVVLDFMDENEVKYALTHPLTMVGSDGFALNRKGPLNVGKPHPRSYGTFPRVLGRYVRDQGVLTLQEAVRKMTSYPAQRLCLWSRGRIAEGFWADLVLFRLDQVSDRATYSDPHQYPSGIEYVMVNGVPVIENGVHTGATPGKALRRR